MGHEISFNGNVAECAVVGAPAWHGLGKVVADAMTAEEAIKIAGLDKGLKNVEKPKYKIQRPDESEAVINEAARQIQELDKYFTRDEVNRICAMMLYLSTQA